MTSITEMPELVLEKIIEFSDFKSVLTLRQVCRDFRNFIDDLNDLKLPDSKFKAIALILNFHVDSSRIPNDSSIRSLPIKLTTIIRKLNRRIKTKTMHIKPFHKSQVIPILQFADPETLKVVRLFPPDEDTEMESDEIAETEQWKKAEKLVCHFCLLNLNVEDVCHFSITYLKTNFMTAGDLDTLRKTFVSSSKYERWTFVCKNFHEQGLPNIWGPAFLFDYSFHWYFRTKESEKKVLDIGTILIKLSTMFGKLNRRFKTSVLEIKPSDKSQVIPVLQLADPETLRSIDLSSSREVLEMEYDGFGETEQWKNAKGLNCHFYLMNLNVKDVCHFSWIDIKVNSLDASDFDTLKKAYTSSSEFKMWQFRLKHFNQREQLSNIWGPPFVLGQDIHWYFRMKNPEEVKILHIDIQDPVSMNVEFYWTDFHLIEMAHVPDGETVHDYKEN
ncbi:unnamed protein product [Caenorhabditis nigoni]